jgi:hypothetical protein
MQMKASQGLLNIADVAKIISVIIVIGLIFSIMPKVIGCISLSHSGTCIGKQDVCHGSTAGIQLSVDTPFIFESACLSGSLCYVAVYPISNFTRSPLLILSQDYSPPKSAS